MPARPVPQEFLFSYERRSSAHTDAVTVAISLYHYAQFIVECLDSVSAQTHPHVEVIIVDDHSTRDESVNIVRKWAERHAERFERLALVRHTHNRGLAAARNTAFREARTEHVFVLDADNLVYPRAVEVLYRAAIEGDWDAAYTQLEVFGDQNGIGQADVWSRRRFQRGNYVDAMALIRARSWRQVGGYTHIEGGWEDFDLWCKFVEAGMTGLYIPQILCRYRVHGASMLRTDTHLVTDAVKRQLSYRHPWLNLV